MRKSPFKYYGLLAGVAIALLFVFAKPTDSFFELSKNLEIFTNVFRELNANYVDPIEPGKMVKTATSAMLDELDPYTNLITEADIEDFEFQTTGKYGGIGASIRTKGENIYIGDVYENSPAQKAGLRPGDEIIDIDGKEIKGKTIDDISILLKGSPGTQVNLNVKDAFTQKVEQKLLTREEIEVSSVPLTMLCGPKNDIAYVKLTQFTPNCGRIVRNALDSLKKTKGSISGVILDLRNNPGGLLDEAVNVCNLFVEKGQLVVTTKGRQKTEEQSYKTQQSPWDITIPVSVLINQSSASASEIVAGTLQDLDRGVIVGQRSYGKGLVQVTKPLGYNARLKLTVARYYTPSGRCIQAIDYSHRDAGGRAEKVADSLQQIYYTKKGRKVKSFAGVSPDVSTPAQVLSKLTVALYSKNFLFDYATMYVGSHKSIAPASTFSLSDQEMNEFMKWIEQKDFSYQTLSQIHLDSLIATAKREKYYEDAKAEFTLLEKKLGHDKKQDLLKHKEEVKRLLENEIVSRYYFMKGRMQSTLITDEEFLSATQLLSDLNQYKQLLSVR